MSYRIDTELYRSSTDSKFGGVCAGLAKRFGISVAAMRLIWAIAIFFTGIPLFLYLLLWFILPVAPNDEIQSVRTHRSHKGSLPTWTKFALGMFALVLLAGATQSTVIFALMLIGIGIWMMRSPNGFAPAAKDSAEADEASSGQDSDLPWRTAGFSWKSTEPPPSQPFRKFAPPTPSSPTPSSPTYSSPAQVDRAQRFTHSPKPSVRAERRPTLDEYAEMINDPTLTDPLAPYFDEYDLAPLGNIGEPAPKERKKRLIPKALLATAAVISVMSLFIVARPTAATESLRHRILGPTHPASARVETSPTPPPPSTEQTAAEQAPVLPSSLSVDGEIPAEGARYDFGDGTSTLDLSEADFKETKGPVPIFVKSGHGLITVILPDDVGGTLKASTDGSIGVIYLNETEKGIKDFNFQGETPIIELDPDGDANELIDLKIESFSGHILIQIIDD